MTRLLYKKYTKKQRMRDFFLSISQLLPIKATIVNVGLFLWSFSLSFTLSTVTSHCYLPLFPLFLLLLRLFSQRPQWPILSHIWRVFSSFIFVHDPTPPPLPLLQSPNPSLEAQIPAPRPKFHPRGSTPRFKAQIPAPRPKYQPQGSNPSLRA